MGHLLPNRQTKELTVCDIVGEWGSYQWSLTLFAVVYSSLFGMTVVLGPIWTPDLGHVCANGSSLDLDAERPSGDLWTEGGAIAVNKHECKIEAANETSTSDGRECAGFIYADQEYGKVLTNSVSSPSFGPRSQTKITRKLPISVQDVRREG